MIRIEATKSWLAKLWGQITPEQGAALAKALLVVGIGLVLRPVLELWPSIGATVIKGAVFAMALVFCFRLIKVIPSLKGTGRWFIPVGIGGFLNYLVCLANGGFMPAVNQDYAVGIYIPIDGAKLLSLCDWIGGGLSPGDILMVIGFFGIVAMLLIGQRKLA